MLKKIISKRRILQVVFAAALYFTISYFSISLLYVLLFGSLLGVVFGKVFCRWMCPVGFLFELMMGSADGSKQQLYMYHKLGCPIAWVSGLLNRFSLFKIKKDENSCISCGKCDKACYISTLNKNYSLYNNTKEDPSKAFSCSKCLECVKACPVNSLSYKV